MPPGYAVIDIETTGFDPQTDRVVSVAVVFVDEEQIRTDSAVQHLVNPGIPIPSAAIAVHGITDEQVRDAPPLATVIEQVAPLLAHRVVVGHNLPFDLSFLTRAGLEIDETLDTLAVSRLLWRWPWQRHGLDAVANRVGVLPTNRHSALGDAIATAEVLVACRPRLAAQGLDSPDAVAVAYGQLLARRARVKRSIRRRSIPRPKVRRSHRHSWRPR